MGSIIPYVFENIYIYKCKNNSAITTTVLDTVQLADSSPYQLFLEPCNHSIFSSIRVLWTASTNLRLLPSGKLT